MATHQCNIASNAVCRENLCRRRCSVCFETISMSSFNQVSFSRVFDCYIFLDLYRFKQNLTLDMWMLWYGVGRYHATWSDLHQKVQKLQCANQNARDHNYIIISRKIQFGKRCEQNGNCVWSSRHIRNTFLKASVSLCRKGARLSRKAMTHAICHVIFAKM